MPTLTETLRTLHRIHRQHSDLKDRLSRGPRQIQVGELIRRLEGRLALKEGVSTSDMTPGEGGLPGRPKPSTAWAMRWMPFPLPAPAAI